MSQMQRNLGLMLLMLIVSMSIQGCKGGSTGAGKDWVPCASNDQCAEGLVCTGGVCAEAKACDTAEDDDFCGAQSACLDGVCKEEGISCASKSDCASYLTCNKGTCTPVECTSNDECADGQACLQEKCTKTIACETDAQCSGDLVCVEEQCSETGKTCEFSIDCPGVQECKNEVCVLPSKEPTDPVEQTCDVDAEENECDEGFECKLGVCKKIPDDTGTAGYTEECNSDSECKGTLTCYDSKNNGKICTRRCEEYADCVDDNALLEMQCAEVKTDGQNIYQCVPRANTYCKPCVPADKYDQTADCGTPGVDLCFEQGANQFFCAPDCSGGKSCPDGSECVEAAGGQYQVCRPVEGGTCGACVDRDQDGYGDPAYPRDDCLYAEPDCDDNDPRTHPYAETACDGKNTACEPWADYEYTHKDENDELVYDHLDHCGGCGIACNLPNAALTCETGTCQVVECDGGFTNLDAYISTEGCTLTCKLGGVHEDNDLPDDLRDSGYKAQFADENCDGIDGDIGRAVFVNASSTSLLQNGSMAAPYKTISAALDSLSGVNTNVNQILVSKGIYNENIVLKDGIGIFGGYDAENRWTRSTANIVTIKGNHTVNGHKIGVRGYDLSSKTFLQNVTIESTSTSARVTGTSQGASSYGVYCTNCDGLRLLGNQIAAGNGANGANAAQVTPAVAAKGGDGGRGNPGQADKVPSGGVYGGAAGTSSCNVPGGAGGAGGIAHQNGLFGTWHRGSADDGKPGSPAPNGGGAGGSKGDKGNPGKNAPENAKNGTVGSNGSHGISGTNAGSIDAGYWKGTTGGNGGNGTNGTGGGGGGGGGGQDCGTCNAGTGNGGGGGGAGGCGGSGGFGGGAGGASVGIYLQTSAAAIVKNNGIYTGKGGNGGAGSAGSSGGAGGLGAYGREVDIDEVGKGAKGGDGGAGGNGGHGGGGGGGPTIGILTQGMGSAPGATMASENTINLDAGGNGGTAPSGGHAGNGGQKTNVLTLN